MELGTNTKALDERNKVEIQQPQHFNITVKQHARNQMRKKPIGLYASKRRANNNRTLDSLPERSERQPTICLSSKRLNHCKHQDYSLRTLGDYFKCNGRNHKNGIFSWRFQSTMREYKCHRKSQELKNTRKDLSGQEIIFLHDSPRRNSVKKSFTDSVLKTLQHRALSEGLNLHLSSPDTRNRCSDLSALKTSCPHVMNEKKSSCHDVLKPSIASDLTETCMTIDELQSGGIPKSPVNLSPTTSLEPQCSHTWLQNIKDTSNQVANSDIQALHEHLLDWSTPRKLLVPCSRPLTGKPMAQAAGRLQALEKLNHCTVTGGKALKRPRTKGKSESAACEVPAKRSGGNMILQYDNRGSNGFIETPTHNEIGTKRVKENSDYNFSSDWSPPKINFLYLDISSEFEATVSSDDEETTLSAALDSVVMQTSNDSSMPHSEEDSQITIQNRFANNISHVLCSQSDVLIKSPNSINNTLKDVLSSHLVTMDFTKSHFGATDQLSCETHRASEKALHMDQAQIPCPGSRSHYNNSQEENVSCISEENASFQTDWVSPVGICMSDDSLSSDSYCSFTENNPVSGSEPNHPSNNNATVQYIDSDVTKHTNGSPVICEDLLTGILESSDPSVLSSHRSDHLNCKRHRFAVDNVDCLNQGDNLRHFDHTFLVLSERFPSTPPGENVFFLAKLLHLRRKKKLWELKVSEVQAQNSAEELFLSSGFTYQIFFVQVGFLSTLYHHKRCPRPMLQWLFQLLSSTVTTSLYSFKALWDISMDNITKAIQGQQEDYSQYLWCPSLENILSVLQCLGASHFALHPLERRTKDRLNRGARYTLSMLEKVGQDHPYSLVLVKNLNNIFKFLTLCAIESPYCFSDNDLLIFIPILCKVSLDINVNKQPMEDLRQLLLILLNNVTDWQTQLSKLCLSLSQLSSHHHNLLSIVQLLPDIDRARQLKKQLSLVIITKLLSRSVSCVPWEESLQLSFLCQLLKYMKPSALKRQLEQGHTEESEGCQSRQARLDWEAYYLCHTLLILANNVVGTEPPSPDNVGNLYNVCVSLQRYISSSIREHPGYMYRSTLKNLATCLHVRWMEMLPKYSPQKRYGSWWDPCMDVDASSREDGGGEEIAA
ncbi:protein FAM178B isoform X3 [Pseudophryne corroboree]|uniref:protein FAM178B isoform X3 n=1 Tax=Pseudophryne corroboree TaxID=495146 RepID=UPI0030818B23